MKEITTPASIVYPALCLGRGRPVAVAHSDADLTCCKARDLWAGGFYDDMVVVDAASDVFRVAEAGSLAQMGFAKRLAARLRNASVPVDLKLRAEGEATLYSIRQRVVDSFMAAASRKGEEGETSPEASKTLVRIRETRSLPELIAIFY